MEKHGKTMDKFIEGSCQNYEAVGKLLLVFSQKDANSS